MSKSNFTKINLCTRSNDSKLFKSIIDQGIDAHLEAFTKSEFKIEHNRLVLNFHNSEIPILVRRLGEMQNSSATKWVNSIQNKMDAYLTHYLVTALWSSTGDDDLQLENKYSIADFSTDAIKRAKSDWEAFQLKAGKLLDGLDLSTVAHDFWLTRNGHGAGFWDGDYEEATGEALTEIAKGFKECDVVECDDGTLEIV